MNVNMNEMSNMNKASKLISVIVGIIGILVLGLVTKLLFDKLLVAPIKFISKLLGGNDVKGFPFFPMLIVGLVVWMIGYLSHQTNGARIYAIVISVLAISIFRIPLFMKAHALLYVFMTVVMLLCFSAGKKTKNVAIKNHLIGFMIGVIPSFFITCIYSLVAIFYVVTIGMSVMEIHRLFVAAIAITIVAHIISLILSIIKTTAENRQKSSQ